MTQSIIPLLVALVVIALLIYGIEMLPITATPKRLFEAALVIGCALVLGHHYHVLGL